MVHEAAYRGGVVDQLEGIVLIENVLGGAGGPDVRRRSSGTACG
jgi:hypothetical protein